MTFALGDLLINRYLRLEPEITIGVKLADVQERATQKERPKIGKSLIRNVNKESRSGRTWDRDGEKAPRNLRSWNRLLQVIGSTGDGRGLGILG